MQKYEFSHYLCIVFRDKVLEYNKESASLLVKSPILIKGYARYGDSSYTVGYLSVRISGCLAIPTRV